jgi:hypothetical protein
MSDLDFEFFATYKGKHYAGLRYCEIDEYVKAAHAKVFLRAARLEENDGKHAKVKLKFVFPPKMQIEKTNTLTFLKIVKPLVGQWYEKQNTGTAKNCEHYELFRVLTDVREFIHRNTRWNVNPVKLDDSFDSLRQIKTLHDFEFGILAIEAYFSQFGGRYEKMGGNYEENRKFIRLLRESMDKKESELSKTEPDKQKERLLVQAYRKWKRQAEISTTPSKDSFEWISSDMIAFVNNYQNRYDETLQRRVDGIKKTAIDFSIPASDILAEFFTHRSTSWRDTMLKWLEGDKRTDVLRFIRKLIIGVIEEEPAGVPISSFIFAWGLANSKEVDHYQTASLVVFQGLLDPSQISSIMKPSDLLQINIWVLKFVLRDDSKTALDLNTAVLLTFFQADAKMATKCFDEHCKLFFSEVKEREAYLQSWLKRLLTSDRLTFDVHDKILVQVAEFVGEPQLYLDVQSHWRNLLIGRSTKERVQYLARIIELLIKRDRLVNNYQYLLASTVFEDHQYIMYPQMAEFFEGCPQSMNFLLQARHDSIKNRDQALSTIFSLLAKDDVQQLLEIGRYMRVYFTSDQTLKGSIEVREFLHKLVDDFQRFNIPLKYVATLLRKDDRGQIDHCIDEKKAQLLSELLANITQLTNADYYQKATHEDDVKKTVTKLAETLINIRFEAQACSSQILLPSHGLIERFTEVKEFQVLLKIFETPGESMKVLGELVKSFEWQTGIKPESLKIFNQKIDDDRFFSAILVVLATKLARIAKKDLSESVKNLASIRCQSVLADVIKQLSKSSRSTDSQSRSNIVDENLDIQFPLFLSARLQETAVRIFEDLADSLLSSSTPELQTLAKLILSDQALQASFRYPKASFQRFQTKQTLDQLCSNDFRRLAELQNAKWLDDEELLDALAAFLNEYKNAKLEPKTPLTLASSLIEAKKFAKSKGRFHQERKDLAEQILPVLVAFSDGRKDLKEFNKVYGVLAEARDLSNRRLDELMLDSNELNQYDLTVHDIAALKACKTALHTSKTWSDLFAGLLVPSNADISCAKSLQDKHQELQTFLKLYKANQAGSEQKKTDDILRILEGADICFYKSHEATEYSLHVFITSAKDSQFDLGKSLEHNLQLDRQMQLEERKTERSNVVDHGAFSAMKAKAAFLLSLHKSSDLNNFEYFYDLATQALEVLVLANSLESSHLVVDFQDALFANFGNELKKCGIRLVIGEDFRSIQVSTRDKQQVMSLALKSLRGYTFELATLSEEAKKTVFHSKRLAFYPWSCFQARHICLVEKFLKSLERADHTTLPDLRRKVQLLFKHAGSSISLDRSDAEMVKVFNKLHGYITYSLLVNLNEVFGISPQTPRRALSPRKSAKSCFLKVLFDQENRIPTLLAICRQRDSEGIEASPRIMFCSPFTSWSEIEVFLLQAIFDLEDRKYTIADSHLLEVEVRHRMLADLEAKAHLTDEHVNYNVCLMAPTKHPSRLAEELADRYQKQFKLTPVSKQGDWKACISKVLLVKSDFAGLGKTHFIEKDAEKSGFKLLVLNLSGQMSPKLLTKRLKPIFVALERSQMSQPLALRLKLDIADDVVDTFHYLDQLLFKICVLQVVEFGSSFLGFERVAQFYIEVQNTLDNRLLKVDFVRFLTKIEGCCISLQPPFRKQLPGLSGGNLEEGDQTSDLLLVDGPNRLDLHYLFRFGLLDSLLLHTLFKQPLIENMVYHKFGQEETLIHYINPAQIIRPLIQDAISREVHYRPDDSEELNSLMQAKPGVLASKLSHLEQKIVVAAAKKRTEIERLLKSAEREFKSSLAYSKIYWLIKSIYSPQELDKSVLESKILSSTTKEERWLLLLAEAEDHFTVKYSGLEDCRLDFLMRSPEGARAIHQEKEARANIVQCIDELLLDLKEESEMPLKYEDVNYYHLKTLIQLVSQFVHQLNRSDSLDISTMKNSSIGPIRDTNITGPTAFRFKLVTKSLEQIRRFAFQQIISVSWLQRQNRLKMMKTSDRDGEAAYLRVLEQLKQQAACHNHWFFLHDGVLKLVHNDDSRLDSDLVGFYYSQMRKPQTLNAEKSQEQYVQELCEAFGGRMTPDTD